MKSLEIDAQANKALTISTVEPFPYPTHQHAASITGLTKSATDIDAARYRWLRQAGAWESESGLNALCENPVNYDAAVDEAMRIESWKG